LQEDRVPGEERVEVGTVPESRRPVEDPRVYLAAERTFLAWIRTSLALMGFGFLIARFAFLIRDTEFAGVPVPSGRTPISPWLGFAMVCFGVVVCLVALARHRRYVEALEAGVANPRLDPRAAFVLAGVLTLVGLAMAIHLLTL
jgi:putative membrane protein